MNEQQLIEALIQRASEDARAFRKQDKGATPEERWIENSYSTALPLANSIEDENRVRPHP